MKKRIMLLLIIILFTTGNSLFSQMTFSGIFDSTVSLRAGAGDSPAFSYGIEEYANIRMQARIRDRARFDGAVNLIAAAGHYAADAELTALFTNASPVFGLTSYVWGQNFIAGIELERLLFRLNFEAVDLEGGLFRLPFGYGQIWKPSDFLSTPNPLKPDARPRAVLGAGLSWFPADEFKLLGFGTAPRNPFSQDGGGGLVGIVTDKHWDKASLQFLYAFESPLKREQSLLGISSKYGIHRAGLSVKADAVVGLVMDALYTYNHEAKTKHDGLSLSAGIDYSFLGGDLIVLAEYLYNGSSSSTALFHGGDFSNEHYLYTGITYMFNSFTNASAALISCFSDISFTPVFTVNHDIFQGATLTVMAQIPLDRDLFTGNGKRGELGPLPPDRLQPLLPINGRRIGRYFDCSVKLRLRF